MNRTIRFLLETLAGLLLAGLLLAVAIPLLHQYLERLPRPLLQALAVAVLAVCVMAITLRPSGSLRR